MSHGHRRQLQVVAIVLGLAGAQGIHTCTDDAVSFADPIFDGDDNLLKALGDVLLGEYSLDSSDPFAITGSLSSAMAQHVNVGLFKEGEQSVDLEHGLVMSSCHLLDCAEPLPEGFGEVTTQLTINFHTPCANEICLDYTLASDVEDYENITSAFSMKMDGLDVIDGDSLTTLLTINRPLQVPAFAQAEMSNTNCQMEAVTNAVPVCILLEPGTHTLELSLMYNSDAGKNVAAYLSSSGLQLCPEGLPEVIAFASEQGAESPPQVSAPPYDPSSSQKMFQSMTVKSDPHFKGLRGQRYDVTGISGRYYSLVSDYTLLLNAKYGIAYATGMYVDEAKNVWPMRPRGTWITQLGITAPAAISDATDDKLYIIKVGIYSDVTALQEDCEPHEPCKVPQYDRKTSYLSYGGVIIGGNWVMDSAYSWAEDPTTNVWFTNRKNWSTVHIVSPLLNMGVDIVPPPTGWQIPAEEKAAYTHLNLNIKSMDLSDGSHGLLGVTKHIRLDAQGNAIMAAYNDDGDGVIEGQSEEYMVPNLWSPQFKYSVTSALFTNSPELV